MAESLFKRASKDALAFGGYLSAIFLASVLSGYVPFLSLVGLLLIIGLPVFVLFRMRTYYVDIRGLIPFSGLWMYGIMLFIFGAIICSAVSFIYLEYLDPDFLFNQFKMILDFYKSVPELANTEAALSMQAIFDKNQFPSAIQFVMSFMWAISFSGSMLSIILALLTPVTVKKDKLLK